MTEVQFEQETLTANRHASAFLAVIRAPLLLRLISGQLRLPDSANLVLETPA